MRVQWLTRNKWTQVLIAGLLALVLVLGWQVLRQQTKPDFARLYQRTATQAQAMPVILIPGVFGSRLRDPATGEEM